MLLPYGLPLVQGPVTLTQGRCRHDRDASDRAGSSADSCVFSGQHNDALGVLTLTVDGRRSMVPRRLLPDCSTRMAGWFEAASVVGGGYAGRTSEVVAHQGGGGEAAPVGDFIDIEWGVLQETLGVQDALRGEPLYRCGAGLGGDRAAEFPADEV